MKQIPYNQWHWSDEKEFEYVGEYTEIWEDYPLNTGNFRHRTIWIYKVNTVDVRGCSHVLVTNRETLHYCHWLTDAIVDEYLGKKLPIVNKPDHLMVTQGDCYFPKGQVLRITGIENGAEQVEAVTVGRFAIWDEGKQHDKDGQIIWISKKLLAKITKQIEN